MGLFSDMDNSVSVNSGRKDDKTGLYWQRIDAIEVAKSRKKTDYLKVSKTTVRVINGLNSVGDETTQCFFRDQYSFFEKEVKRFCMGVFGLTVEEADELTGDKIQELLITNGTANGIVIEVQAREMVNSKDETKTYVNHKVIRAVPQEELEAALDANDLIGFGLAAA